MSFSLKFLFALAEKLMNLYAAFYAEYTAYA